MLSKQNEFRSINNRLDKLSKTLELLQDRFREFEGYNSRFERHHLETRFDNIGKQLQLEFWEDVSYDNQEGTYRAQVAYQLKDIVQLILDELNMVPRTSDKHYYLLDKEEADAE